MANDREAQAGLGQAAQAFNAEVLRPMLAASVDDPDAVRTLAAALREKLDALELLLADSETPGRRLPQRANGQAAPDPRSPAASRDEDIGRNQRSRVREMTLLDILAAEARPFSLQQLMRALDDRGFAEGQPAVVSQLHRMKKVGVIEQPANGMYEVTEEGLAHLRKLKSSVGALVRA
ncbi:MAG: hypothetical protein ACOYLQ_04895 [Hyphomicrobiaceae bacterium]